MEKMEIADLKNQPQKVQPEARNVPPSPNGLSGEKKTGTMETKNQIKEDGNEKDSEKGGKTSFRQKKPKKKQRIKGNWKKEEDILLMKLVRENGARNWSKIAENFPNRIGKQCRERWHNHLNPKINKKKWTEQEEAILLVTHERFGNRWALISKYLPGRTDNCIKNHWNSTMKRKLRNNFFKNYPLEELKGHLFNGQEDLLEQHTKRGRRKRKTKDAHAGNKRGWTEAMPELSKQTRELDFISSLQSNAQKMPFRWEHVHTLSGRSAGDLPLQSLLTLLPSPFLSDSLTNLNNLTTSLQSLLSLLLTKNPMKTPLCPLKLLKQILKFLEINVSSQIQDHFPEQCRFDVKKNFISFLKKDNHLERKKFDQEMKIALDKKIQMMEQEKDRNYQLAKLIETIKTKNTPPGQKNPQEGLSHASVPKQLIRPVSKRLKPQSSNYSIQKSGSMLSQGPSPFARNNASKEAPGMLQLESTMPKADLFASLQENSAGLKRPTAQLDHPQSKNQRQRGLPVVDESFKHMFMGNFINKFKFHSRRSPLKRVKTGDPLTFKHFPEKRRPKEVSTGLKTAHETTLRGTSWANEGPVGEDRNRAPVYVSLFDSSSIFNKNVVERDKNCFTSPHNFENKNNSNLASGCPKNELQRKDSISRESPNNADAFPLRKNSRQEIRKVVNSRNWFNAVELEKKGHAEADKSNISRNLNWRFKRIFEEKKLKASGSPAPKQLEHLFDLDSILDEEILKKNLSGEFVNPNGRHLQKPFLEMSQVKTSKTEKESFGGNQMDSVPRPKLGSGLFREITSGQNSVGIPQLEPSSKLFAFDSDLQLRHQSKLFPSNVLREKTNLLNQKSKGKFISSFVLKKSFLFDDSLKVNKQTESTKTVKENISVQVEQTPKVEKDSILHELST